MTGPSLALGDVFRAILALVSFPTGAGVVIDQVGAGGVMKAWRHRTFINLLFTVVTKVSSVVTVAGEQIDTIKTLATVKTRTGGTVVDVDLAVSAIVARGALTCVVVDSILTHSAILTRLRLAFVNINLAVGP